MKRKDALVYIRVAGYHNDQHSFIRLYTENRVSYSAARAEFQRGAEQKLAGVRCECYQCKKQKEGAQ